MEKDLLKTLNRASAHCRVSLTVWEQQLYLTKEPFLKEVRTASILIIFFSDNFFSDRSGTASADM